MGSIDQMTAICIFSQDFQVKKKKQGLFTAIPPPLQTKITLAN